LLYLSFAARVAGDALDIEVKSTAVKIPFFFILHFSLISDKRAHQEGDAYGQ